MEYLDDWHDFLRPIAFVLNIYSLYVLAKLYRHGAKDWNTKSIDLWYSLVAWCGGGAVLSLQSIYLDRPFTPGFVLITAAALVTAKGLHRKGAWGAED